MSGPVFGRAPVRKQSRLQRENEGDDGGGSDKFKETKAKSDLKVKLVQYEIAQKEACRVIKNLCDEVAEMSNVDVGGSNYENIDDLLAGILLLGNLSKRIGTERNNIEFKFKGLQSEYSALEVSKKNAIEQLEGVILRLQAENVRATDLVTEITTKHNQKLILYNKEIFTLRETVNELRTDNEKLTTKLQFQERRVMDIPRLEEQYLRTARSIVRQQEVSNTMNKIEIKKVEEEVKNMNSFKSKAKCLEEQVEELKSEVENLTNQNRLSLSRYQALQQEFHKYKIKRPNAQGNSQQPTASSNASCRNRPSSAPAVRSSSSTQSLARMASGYENEPALRPNSSMRLHRPQSAASLSRIFDSRSAKITSTQANPVTQGPPSNYKSTEDLLNEEIVRLHVQLQKRDKQIMKMTQRLSLARAYPLRATEDVSDDILDDSRSHTSERSKMGTMWDRDETLLRRMKIGNRTPKNVGHLVGDNLHEMNYMLDESESVSTSFRLEEENLQAARVKAAMDLQEEYNKRFAQQRANLPPHIAAIRNSKSFLKVLKDEHIL